MTGKHVILAAVGTAGDVFPFIGLGAVLRGRGHRVTLASSESFRALAMEHGFEFLPLISLSEDQAMLSNPDLWHPLKSIPHGQRWLSRGIQRHWELLEPLAQDPSAVLVAPAFVLAARIIQEQLGCPLATVILQPWMIASVVEPPVMPSGLGLPPWMPRPLGQLYWFGIDMVGGWFIGRNLNRVRRSAGLPPVRRVFQWWLSPQRVIALFPDWYGPPQSDWPPQLKQAGFPVFDGSHHAGLPSDTEAFCTGGEPPVAFTFGSEMMHSATLFRAALEACEALGCRGLFVTKFRDQLPASMPSRTHHCSFAPFGRLFPRCAAVVHHGGIGTTARALAAGTPQVVLPLAYDQPDNAARIRRLGVGVVLKRSARNGKHLTPALRHVMADETGERCRQVAARFEYGDALNQAAGWVEELAR